MMTKDMIGPAEAMRKAAAMAAWDARLLPIFSSHNDYVEHICSYISSAIRALPIPAQASEPTAEGREAIVEVDATEALNELDAIYSVLGNDTEPAAHQVDVLMTTLETIRAKLARMKAALTELAKQPWERCPLTRCERREECCSPNDCSGTGRPIAISALDTLKGPTP